MVRPVKWISSLTLGVAFACQVSLADPPGTTTTGEPKSAQAAATGDAAAQPAADDCDDAAECLDDAELVDDKVVPAHSIDTNAPSDEGFPDGFNVGRGHIGDSSASGDVPVSELIKERFPNGTVKIERRVTQDSQQNYLNHGSWKMWDQRGNAIAQGAYEYGNRTGTWTRWYRAASEAELFGKMPYQQFSEPFISQATFKHDQLDGLWTIYDGKMRKISQINFADGKRQGTATWSYANGRKMREAEYRDGTLDGQYLEWSPEGKLIARDTYQAGRKLATKVVNHPGGGKKSEAVYLFAKEIEKSGDDWANCRLMTTAKNGGEERHGAWVSWYSNGQMQLEGTYEHDVQVGKFTWWHSNGQKAQEGRFEHGKQDGPWTWWFPTGQKSIRGEYVTGNPTGKWTWWKEDGRVVQSADLSHSDGVVIDTTPDGVPMPRTSSPPTLGQPVKR